MNYVERCLYDYKANIAEIEILSEQLDNIMSLHGHSYEIYNSQGESDPVGNIVSQKLKLERKIFLLQKRVKPVDKLIDDLKGSSIRRQQMLEILKLKYIQHEDKDFIKKSIAISEATFWRRIKELRWLARRYFGFMR